MSAYQSAIEHLSKRHIVITPNNRLCRALISQYAHTIPNHTLIKPLCFSYNEFLNYLFLETSMQLPSIRTPLLLKEIHIRRLWREVIQNTKQFDCTEGLLQALINAWTLCHTWQVPLEDPAFQHIAQHQQFQRWVRTIEKTLQSMHAISEHHLPSYLNPHLSHLALPETLVWLCFDDYTPTQLSLHATFNELGYQIIHQDLTPQTHQTYQLEVEEKKDEYLQLIQWLKAKPSTETVAVVIPSLENEAQKIMRLMTHELASTPINISFSQPLSTYPLIAHALEWLSLDLVSISPHQLNLLLTSSYLFKAHQEHIERAEWMVTTTLLQDELIEWPTLLQALPPSLPHLKKILQNLTSYPTQASLAEWLNLFEQRLKTLGFPGETELDSISYQCLQRLIHLFDEFRQLTLLTPRMTQQEALATLRELAEISSFQPEKKQAQIQILGILEASGCTFDNIWVMHMTDQNFPQKGHLSAFIPISIQKKLDMPHSNEAREIKYALQTFQRLCAGSAEQIFSYARFDGDSPCLPSPLLEDIPTAAAYPIELKKISLRFTFKENYTLPLNPIEHTSGGTSLLANQAKCPFRAFAAHRLHLKKEASRTHGLNPQERGQILHLVLEKLWQQIQSQQQLITMSDAALDKMIEQTINEVLTQFTRYRTTYNPLLKTIEIQRITQLIQACFQFEKNRPAFIVEAVEKNATIELAGLTFHVKLDRLDILNTGEKWVVDYKSRIPTQKPWREERPEEPQLLLYALLDKAIHGLLFIELRHGQIQCAGLTDAPPLPGMHTVEHGSWDSHQTRWHQQLTQLALEFKEGNCYPNPVRSSLCQECEFKSLCRVQA